jgi:hypothetical protein
VQHNEELVEEEGVKKTEKEAQWEEAQRMGEKE